MKEGLIKDAYEAIIKELQTVISICYILTVGIGMLFNYQLYSEFSINIFDYADVFDFLLAPFSDYKILLFSLVSIAISYVIMRLDMFWKNKYPKSYSRSSFGWDKKSWYNTFRYISFALGFMLYLYASADLYGRVSKTEILSQPPIKLRFADNEVKTGIMIGKTKDMLFLMSNEKVEAVPITTFVKSFDIK